MVTTRCDEYHACHPRASTPRWQLHWYVACIISGTKLVIYSHCTSSQPFSATNSNTLKHAHATLNEHLAFTVRLTHDGNSNTRHVISKMSTRLFVNKLLFFVNDLRVFAWSTRDWRVVKCVKSRTLRVLMARWVNDADRSSALISRDGPISSARRRVKRRNDPAPDNGAMQSCVSPCNLVLSHRYRIWLSDMPVLYDTSSDLRHASQS